MQVLHTHEAVQAGEGGSVEQLVCGQFVYKHIIHQRLYSHSEIDIKRGETSQETAAQTHTLLINHICNINQMYLSLKTK